MDQPFIDVIHFDSVRACLNSDAYVAVIDGNELHVPNDPNNRHCKEINRQVAEGTLTIQEAE